LIKGLESKGIENYLRAKGLDIDPGAFDHIPHYARDAAVEAIRRVRDLERRHVFRPGLYYIVLSDLCRSTEVSARLGAELNKKRIETFVSKCIEILGDSEKRNYYLFLREIGDAVLVLFSSFQDVYEWWIEMSSWLDTLNKMWQSELSEKEYRHFFLETKTIVHTGEVTYSGDNIPAAQAVNQVFKIEKTFRADELGITQSVLVAAGPIIRDLRLAPRRRGALVLPGERAETELFLADKIRKRPMARPR